MTNVDEIFEELTKQGQSPRIYSDTYIMLELMGHRLDREVERNFVAAKAMEMQNTDITNYIEDHVKMSNVLKTTMKNFDGGYVVCGITGSGEMFSMRDPWGIRPAFYYKNDEIVVVASERPVLQTTFDLEAEEVQELMPGTALLVKKNGECSIERIMEQKGDSACSFERIYFSRGSDKDIYKERKQLGEQLTQPILKAVDYDVDHTVFSYIPNTAEVAYYGMLSGFKKYLNETKIEQIANLDHVPSKEELYEILGDFVRSEKIAWKDIKLRTFITEGNSRNDLASHVYDVTYGSIEPNVDNLVIIDDSIVRGTTLKESILRILDRLHPKKIVVVSSAPQIRYPDYYGIDMARLEEFCVFRAAIQLLKERKMEDLIEQTYEVTYGSIEPNVDNLVIIDDSIVRGTTLKESILRILDRLHPKKIVVVSSAPQIRYPDYYGIDMARLEEFCVFRAAIQLLKERKMEDLIEQTYEACKAELAKPKEEQINPVRSIYKPFSTEEINEKIVEMLRPEGMTTPIQLVFQSIEGLREAIPNHKGDWYFTGHYPTPGGTKLCNQSFVNYIENVYHK